MRLEGERTYLAEPETLRLLLSDPTALRSIIPGCQVLEATGPNDYRLCLTLRLGQNVETFEGVLTLDQAAHAGDITFDTSGTLANTAAVARGKLTFDRQPGGETRLSYEAHATAHAPLPISSRLLQTTGRAFVRRCLEQMERQVAIRTRVYTTSAEVPASAMPDSTAHDREAARRRLSLIAVLALLALLLGLGRRVREASAGAEGSAA